MAAFVGVFGNGRYLYRDGNGFPRRNFNTVFRQAGQRDFVKAFDGCGHQLFVFTIVDNAQVIGIFQPALAVFANHDATVFQDIDFDHFSGGNADQEGDDDHQEYCAITSYARTFQAFF